MKEKAIKVRTPGTSKDALIDTGTLVYGNGVKKTSPEIQTRREKAKKDRKEASKKVATDLLNVTKEAPKRKKSGRGKVMKKRKVKK